MFNLNIYKEKLSTFLLGQSIQYYPKLNSTNTKAWELIPKNAENGTVVITDNQLKGRGRQSNKWSSTPSKSLTFSIILYPDVLPSQINLYSLFAGLAITDCLIENNIQAQLKWPNDILINGKKVGGILCESKISGEVIQSMVIGIGLNVNVHKTDLPQALQNATSLFIESEKQYQLEKLLANICNHLEYRIKNVNTTRSQLLDWEKRCAHLNQAVTFHVDNQIIGGTFKGLSPTGQARMLIDNKEVCFNSGELFN
jgi:BirA family biotin operon repressor/biotin-[acetyl-CoA-carboxylase] ligase